MPHGYMDRISLSWERAPETNLLGSEGKNFMQIAPFWVNVPALFGIILARYFFLSFLAQRFFPPIRTPEPGQISREIRYSIFTTLLFAIAGALVLEGWKHSIFPIYFEIDAYGWPYFVFSIALLIFGHETYFYFTHRLLHHPYFYRRFHLVHHLSRHPTSFASFSFHPVEGILEAMILPILFFLIPAHPAALLIFLAFMSVLGATNHLGREFYPLGTASHWFGKWWIGPTHHGMHHYRVKGNYGLYFTFWDRWLKTEFIEYSLEFSKAKKESQLLSTREKSRKGRSAHA